MTENDITLAFAEIEKDLGLSSTPANLLDNSHDSYDEWEFGDLTPPAEKHSAKPAPKKAKISKAFIIKAILLIIASIVLLASLVLTARQTLKLKEATAEANSIISSASLEASEIIENAKEEASSKVADANVEAEQIKEDIE